MNAAQRITVALLGMVVGAVMVLAAGVIGATRADADGGWKTCPVSDAPAPLTRCVWDAKHSGDGASNSYLVRRNGEIRLISHRKAHRLLYGDGGIGTAVAVAAKCSSDEGGIKGQSCFWDARHQGNGQGRSFKRRWDGTIKYVSHARAHCMTRLHVVGSCPGGGH